jgi:glycosyltransferase involved in cell wall biosynthesis
VKIALIVPGGVDRGGTERVVPFLLWLIERLAARHELHVFALRQEPRPDRWELLGAAVHNVGARPRRIRAVASILAEHRRGSFDVLHAHWAVPQGLVGALAKRVVRRPLVLGLAGGELEAIPECDFGGMRNARGRTWVRAALAAADRIVVPGPAMVEDAHRLGHRAEVVRLGVALDRWPARAPRRRAAGETARLLQIADLSLVKDQETLLRAAASLVRSGVDFRLEVVGTDTLGGRVQELAHELGVADRVRFRGFLPHRELRPLVEASDLLIVTSRFEAGPVAPLEAAVAGVPTVGTAVGYVREWTPDAGVAVPVADPEALAQAIGRVLADEDGRLALAAAAQRRALAHDADAMAAGFEAVYRSAAAGA